MSRISKFIAIIILFIVSGLMIMDISIILVHILLFLIAYGLILLTSLVVAKFRKLKVEHYFAKAIIALLLSFPVILCPIMIAIGLGPITIEKPVTITLDDYSFDGETILLEDLGISIRIPELSEVEKINHLYVLRLDNDENFIIDEMPVDEYSWQNVITRAFANSSIPSQNIGELLELTTYEYYEYLYNLTIFDFRLPMSSTHNSDTLFMLLQKSTLLRIATHSSYNDGIGVFLYGEGSAEVLISDRWFNISYNNTDYSMEDIVRIANSIRIE